MSVALAKVESWEDHIEAWHDIGRQVDGASWRRAAIAASVKGKWGEVSKFAKEVGFTTRSVQYYASTFEIFPEVRNRFRTLTFTHHLRAVALAASAEQARGALREAESQGWSVSALAAYLKPPELPAESGPDATPDGEDESVFEAMRPIKNLFAAWPMDKPLAPIIERLRLYANHLEEIQEKRNGKNPVPAKG